MTRSAASWRVMAEPLSTSISLAALVISGVTAWLTLFRRGTIRMTKPTFVAFAYDTTPRPDRPAIPKVFLRALIYSTGKRGHIVENMFVTLRRGETRQTFNIWGYGDEKLVRSSGMYVGETGVAYNHHFNPPEDSAGFNFGGGKYQLDVFAALVGIKKPIHLSSVRLTVPERDGMQLQDCEYSYWFDWASDSNEYQGHLEHRRVVRADTFVVAPSI